MKDLSVFERLTNLEILDITGNHFKHLKEEEKGTVEKEIEGQKFEVTGHSHSLTDFFKVVPHIKELKCDDDIAEFIIDENKAGRLKDILPNLQTINRIIIPKTFNEYKVEKEVQFILQHLWKYACTYR